MKRSSFLPRAFARARAVVGLVLVLSLGARVAAAESETAATRAGESDPETVARQHYQRGEAHYTSGRFVEALGEYQAGYDAVPLPGFLVNIAQCRRRLGDLKQARVAYQKFVLVAPDSPLVPEVRGLIRDLDKQLDGSAKGPGATWAGVAAAGPLAARPPGEASAPGAELTLARQADRGAPSSGGSDGSKASSTSRWWFWGTLGVVSVAGTIALLALTPGGSTAIHDGSLGTLRR